MDTGELKKKKKAYSCHVKIEGNYLFASVIRFWSVDTKAQGILYDIQRAVYIVGNEIRKKANSASSNVSCCPVSYSKFNWKINPYPTAFPYGNGMVLHFYEQQESSTTKTVHKVINKGLKTYV